MSIESEILRIQRNVANAYAAVSEKGGEVPLQPTSANLEAAVRSIQTGVTQEQLDEAMAVKQDKLTGHPGQVVGFNTSGTAQTVQGWSNPNLLDNWYFADPINQRGQAGYSIFDATQFASVYTIDRFKILASAGTSMACNIEDDHVALSAIPSTGENEQVNFLQIFAPNVLPPGVYTLSWLYSSDCQVRPFAATNESALPGYRDFPASDTPTVASIQIKITEEMQKQSLIFNIQINSSVEAYVDLYAAKLELGAQQTLAHQDINGNWVLNDPPPNKALELLKCQRYLAAYRSAEIYNASVFFGTGILDGYDAEGNTSGQGYIVMPCAMRATPAIIGPTAIYSSVANAPIIRIDIIGVTGNVLRFNFTVTGQVSLEQRMCMIWTAGDLFVTADL